jgi:hypothetical protein
MMGNCVMIALNTVVKISDDILARKIEGETILIPLTAGVGNADEELYSLNTSALGIWEKLDGLKTLEEICRELVQANEAPLSMIQQDVLGFISELISRKMVVCEGDDTVSPP